jgi:hypothetical protein
VKGRSQNIKSYPEEMWWLPTARNWIKNHFLSSQGLWEVSRKSLRHTYLADKDTGAQRGERT